MWLLPYEHFYIETHLSREKIVQKLHDVTDTTRRIVWFPTFASRQHKLYLGKVNEANFSIYRWIHHRDSFLPVIDGELLSQNEGSKIKVRMHLHWLVIIFMTLWLGFFGLAFANQTLYLFRYVLQTDSLPANWSAGIVIPAFFFLFAYGMMIFGFKVDVKRERQFILKLTEAYNVIELGLFERELNT
jgi:hypothetical protein